MIHFKQFLAESMQSRVNQKDILKALEKVSSILNIPVSDLKDNLLGSSRLTAAGKKADSGDIDIAVIGDPLAIHKKMFIACGGTGVYNSGTKVGSYQISVNGKLVKVDLMFGKSKYFTKWAYHSSEGDESKYPGSVRNIILTTALAYTQIPGEDFVLRDADGKPIARASKSIKLNSGMERLFKARRFKNGKLGKTINPVSPEMLKQFLKSINSNAEFSHDSDFTDDPDEIAQFIFGKSVKGNDLMTAESVIDHIKKLKNSKEILKACKSELIRNRLPVPDCL